MPRIRSIKPEMPHDERLAKVSREARYTWVLCITQADDEGYFRGCPRTLLGNLYPHDEDVTESKLVRWLDELLGAGMLQCFDTADGIIALFPKWKKHQKIDHPSKSFLAALSRDARETFARHSRRESRVLSLESLTESTHLLADASANGPEPRPAKKRTAPDYPPEVLAFWQAYASRRRRGKPDVLRQWKAQGCSAIVPEVMAGLERYRASDQWRDGFEVEPARWLKRRGWEDEPVVSAGGDGW